MHTTQAVEINILNERVN